MNFKTGDIVELFMPEKYKHFNKSFSNLYKMNLPLKGIILYETNQKIAVNFAPFSHPDVTHNCDGSLEKSTGRYFYKNSNNFNQFDNSQMIRMAKGQLEFDFS